VWVRESERGATVSAESGGKAEAKSGRGELRMAEPGKGLGKKRELVLEDTRGKAGQQAEGG